MKTNDIKKGMQIKLRGTGWLADMVDNARGNIRIAKVYGFETETGSVYAHDIEFVKVDGKWQRVEHTPAQIELRGKVDAMGW